MSAHDRDNEDITYSLFEAPAGFSIDEVTGEITYDRPSGGLSDGLELTVVASDGKLAAERVYGLVYDQRPEFAGDAKLYVDPDEVGSDTPVLITGVNASDSDNEDITYSLFEAPAGFSIDEVTGEITYDGPLSGLSDGLELAVVASDGKLEAVRQYSLVYDQRPEFAGDARLYVDPDEVGGDIPVLITGVSASDSDNEDITYSLFEAPADFSIDEDTGEIKYDGPLSGLSDGLELLVFAYDGKLYNARHYEITYDQRPEFSADAPTEVYFDPDDKPQAGQSVISFGYFSAIDTEGDSISYSIASHPEGFAVTDQGELTYQGDLADLTQSTELEIIASDGELFTSHVVTVTEYHRPDFEPDQLTDIFIDDNAPPSRFAQFASTDEDPDNTITYSVALSDGTETDQFLIDRQGNLSLAVNVSDINDNTALKITADNGTLAITKMVKIYKRDLESDVDEAAYHVLARDISGLLNNELGLLQGEVSYQIRSGNKNGFFIIDQTNGHLLANGLDYETRTEHLVEIVVRQDGRIISVPVKINVQDVYEGFVINNADIVMMVSKNSGSDSYVGTVQATSLDGVSMTFGFDNPLSNFGYTHGDFKIDSRTGVVRTKRSHISQGVHTLPIWISDGTTARKIQTKIIVGPRGSKHFDDSISFSIAENAASGTFVGNVQNPNPIPDSGAFGVATDDKPPLPYQFSIVSGNSDGAFYIDNSSGRLYVNGLVDYEATDRGAREIVVRATNGFDLQNSTVNINVADVNEAPVFSNGLSFAVAADFEQGDRLFNVGAYDEEDGDLTYEIIQNSHSDLYSITDEGEIIAIQSAATAGISPVDISELSVRASDGINSTVRTISIKADSSAALSADEIQGFTIQAYRGSEGQTVGTVQVEAGPDAIGALTYEIVAGNDNGLFTINHETGLITTTGMVTEGISTLLIGVRQEGEQQYTSISAQIEALIPEDQKPLIYTNQVVLLHPHEEIGRGTYIGQVVALNLGGGALRYELASDDTDELQINQYTGEIYAKSSGLSKTTYPVVVRNPLNDQVNTVNFHITRDRQAALNWIVNRDTGYPEGAFVRGAFAYYYDEKGKSYFGGDGVGIVVGPDGIADHLGYAYDKARVAREQAKREAIPTHYRAVFDAGENAVERIHNFAHNHSGTFKHILKQAFGTKVTDQMAEQLTQRVLDDELPLPAFISVINSDLFGNDGAYSETDGGIIYIRDSILGDDPAVIERILLEEIGHHLDHFLGGGDAAGDEGDIFASAIISGSVLSEAELAGKRAENDNGRILDGLTSLDVEFGTWTERLILKISDTSGIRRRPLRPGSTETSTSRGTTYRTINVENEASNDVELTTYSNEPGSEASSSTVETSFTQGTADDLVAFGERTGELLLPGLGAGGAAGAGAGAGVGAGGVARGAGFAVAGVLGLAGTAAVVGLAFWKHFQDENNNNNNNNHNNNNNNNHNNNNNNNDDDDDDDNNDDDNDDSGSILDLVNSPPVFDDAADDITISINSEWTASASAPRTLINVHATDKDGDTLSYSVNVVADNGDKSVSNDFDIDQATADLRLINDAGAIPDNQKLSIEVSDGSRTVSRLVLVDIDQPPQFAADTPSTVYVDPDEIRADVPLAQIHADDGDSGDEVVYELRDPVENFSINSTSGAVNYSGSALVDGTTLTIVASDGKFTTDHQLAFSIDQRPEFVGSAVFYLDPDEISLPLSLSGVSAQDRDNEDISYRLAAASEGFSIDEATGEVTYKGPLSGLSDGLELAVVASDGKLAAERVYEITYDQRPEFEGSAVFYLDPDEISLPLTLSGVSAHDPDNEDITYSLFEAPAGFNIDRESGEITYDGPLSGLPDGLELTVVASDGKLAAERVYGLVYDQRPEFAGDAKLYVDPDEVGSDTPVLITGVNASDSDNEDITYSLFEAPAGFSIDEATGEVTYDGPLSGLPDGLELAVVASDGKLAAERVYEITYDQRPEFTTDVPTGIVLDNDASHAGISQVFDFFTATDADNDLLRYELLGDTYGFSVDTSTGTLTFAGDAGTVAADAVLNINVTGYDPGERQRRTGDDTPGQPKLGNQHQVSIYKADLSGYIYENENTDILDVSSLIPSGATAHIEGDGSDRFSLENGVLRPVEPFDYETGLTEFSLQLLIDDSSDHIIAPLTINVRDVDEPPAFSPDAPSKFVYDPYAVPIREGAPVVLGRGFTAIDPDAGASAPTYSFTIVRNGVETQTDDLLIDADGQLLYSGVNGLGDDIDTLRITASGPVLSDTGIANSTQISVVMTADHRPAFVAAEAGSRQSYYVYYDRDSIDPSTSSPVQIGGGFRAVDPDASDNDPSYSFQEVGGAGLASDSTNFSIDNEGRLFYIGIDALPETVKAIRITARDTSWPGEQLDNSETTVEVPLYSGFERTDAWGDKFIYGAWSTLISSYLLGVEFKDILPLMNDIHANSTQLRERIDAYIQRYQSLTEQEVKDIITYADNDMSGSIYEEERSVIATPEQNAMFMQAMHQHPELSPIDNILGESGFTSTNIQFNAHRSGYNHAFGIPQNSMAAVLNAYVAGIRNVEWDILTTTDGVSVVSHDLATNRLTGDYFNVRQMIEQSTYDQVRDTEYTVLNPLSAAPEYTSSGIKLHTSADMMAFINEYTPEIVSYIDARNDAPIAFAQLLNSVPDYKEKAVIKVYPFTLGGGVDQFIDKYATQYTSGDLEQAKQQLSDVNVLLVFTVREFNDNVLDDTSLELQDLIDAGIPYRVGSTDSALQFDGQDIFTEEQLESIQTKTQIAIEGIAGYAARMNVQVIQYAAHWPLSLLTQNPVTDDTRAIFNGLSDDRKLRAAVTANVTYLIDKIKTGDLTATPSLEGRFDDVSYGFSDRYPDYHFAERDADGNAEQGTLNHYYYEVVRGKVEVKFSEGAVFMRDSHSLLGQLMSRNDYRYITTDLPTDLRLGYMGLLGKEGIPDRILYHPAGLIKERYNPEDLNGYATSFRPGRFLPGSRT